MFFQLFGFIFFVVVFGVKKSEFSWEFPKVTKFVSYTATLRGGTPHPTLGKENTPHSEGKIPHTRKGKHLTLGRENTSHFKTPHSRAVHSLLTIVKAILIVIATLILIAIEIIVIVILTYTKNK